jgi:hypothetical protein
MRKMTAVVIHITTWQVKDDAAFKDFHRRAPGTGKLGTGGTWKNAGLGPAPGMEGTVSGKAAASPA